MTDMPEAFDVDIAPDASALRMFKNMAYTPWYAVGEFVDNSITSALRSLPLLRRERGADYGLELEITFTEDHCLVVKDNAAGISHTELPRALRTGRPPSDVQVGLSRHGVGMKAAGFWWGRRIEIETYPLGEPSGWHVSIDLGDDDEVPMQRVTVVPLPLSDGRNGTTITVHDLWKGRPHGRTLAAIKAYLPSIYRTYLAAPAELPCRMRLDGTALSFSPPEILEAPFWPTSQGPGGGPRLQWRLEVDIAISTGKRVRGWVAILKSMNRDLSGLLLHYRGKGISGVRPLQADDEDGDRDAAASGAYKPRSIFGQSGSYRDQSFFGELDVSDFGKSITTDSVQWTAEEEQELCERLLALLKDPSFDMWTMAETFRRRLARPPKEDQKVLEGEAARARAALDRRVSHGTPPTADTVEHTYAEDPAAPPSSQDASDGTAVSFLLHDLDDHHHDFKVRISTDPRAPFLSLRNITRHTHEVTVNESHPSLTGIPIQIEGVRKLLVRVGLAIAGGELFSEGHDMHLVREKMNEILYLIGRQSNAQHPPGEPASETSKEPA